MRYLSLFSGIEAASVAWHPLGWTPVAFAEIEPFPSAVLAERFPDVPNFGDVSSFKEWNIDGTVDLIVGGSPCQSFSVAGLRKGLDDPRGNLALTYLAIVDKYRPEWIVWENVPGVLSSNRGRDFGSFLGALDEIGYGYAWRVLDAQYVRTPDYPRAVPQRRRRVFVVGNLRDAGRAAAVLFDSESLFGNPTPRRTKRQNTSTTFGRSPSGNDSLIHAAAVQDQQIFYPNNDETSPTVTSKWHKGSGGPAGSETGNLILGQQTWWDGGETASALTTRCHDQSMPDKANFAAIIQPNKQVYQSFSHHQPSKAEVVGLTTDNCASVRGDSIFVQESVCYETNPTDARCSEIKDGVGPTVKARWGTGGNNQALMQAPPSMQVRRLTPLECERLQGFPDNWTQIPWRNKTAENCPDSPRYKAIGNSMAVNVMQWIGIRIAMVQEICDDQD